MYSKGGRTDQQANQTGKVSEPRVSRKKRLWGEMQLGTASRGKAFNPRRLEGLLLLLPEVLRG